LTWEAFTAARRFDDGVLLFQGPWLVNWLPAEAITQGSLTELELLLREKLSDWKRL
jgi:hypothetical protein